MKKIILFFIVIFLFLTPCSFAEEFDTNILSKGETPTGNSSNLYKYWAYYRTTGTRYVIKVYDWNTERYIAVPKEYYINHVFAYDSSGKVNTNRQIMFLGVDKTYNGKYDVVKSGNTIFTDNTYSHVIKWYDNSSVSNFGLTKTDVSLLAGIIRDKAKANRNYSLEKNMQNIIDGKVPYEVRAEILFLMKLPGTDGAALTARVEGKGSMEAYSFNFYKNRASSQTSSSLWRKDYFTYLELKGIAYRLEDDSGMTMKSTWLDKIACALYENDYDYVFGSGGYQCSCDLYKRQFQNAVTYSLVDKTINLNQASRNPNDEDDRRYMYYTPGRCGIPINVSGRTYYLTPGQTYNNLNGKKVTINEGINYSDTTHGIKVYDDTYLDVVSNNASAATIYEGWDYISNNMASTLVIGCDKDTGNIIKVNNVTYSEFTVNVTAGRYPKYAWDIPGYDYLGYVTRNDFSGPNVPVGISNTNSSVDIVLSSRDVSNRAKRQVIFVYQKTKEQQRDKQAKISIYKLENEGEGGSFSSSILYTGDFTINSDNVLSVSLYDKDNILKYKNVMNYDLNNGFVVNTNDIEGNLNMDLESFEYVGNLIKINSDLFLEYFGETLEPNGGNIFNLNSINNNKVHIILGYREKDVVIDEGEPELKISYIDIKGNSILGIEPVVTVEKIKEDIISTAEDLKKNKYMYVGYTYVDSYDEFANIVAPIKVLSNSNSVITNFERGRDRRHIAFVYRKIEIKFEINIIMTPNDLENQLVGQKVDENYWVLDEPGKVMLKVKTTGTEGLSIGGYTIKLKIPFDTYVDGEFIPANSINNLNVSNINEIVIADKLFVPVWVEEKIYDIMAVVEVHVNGYGTVSGNKSDDVEVVGKLYDFTIINLDGSDKTGDEKWKESLFSEDKNEYKANVLPIGQRDNQSPKYKYGIKLGANFYFSINTKGMKNNAISIVPKFIYISEDGKNVKDVDVFFKDNDKLKNILSDDCSELYLKIRNDNILKESVIKEIETAQKINKVLERYNYSIAENRSIGKFANVVIPKYLSLPYTNYINEYLNMYGNSAIKDSGKTENEILCNVSHWYGRFVIPPTSIIVDKNGSSYKDGYLVVLFKIVSLKGENEEYLSYGLPEQKTQWEKENLNQVINLPEIKNADEISIRLDTLKDNYAPVIIYQIDNTTLDNNTSVGTH